MYRNTKNINLDALRLSIVEAKIDDKIEAIEGVDGQVKVFNDELSKILNINAPLKSGTISIRPN